MTNTTFDPELVRQFVARYFEATRSNDAQEWASRFALNAIVEDPVGTAPINNPTKLLEFGKAFISNFQTIGLHEEFVHAVGDEAAARWTGKGVNKEGKQVHFEGINIFKFDRDGKIINLKGYWNPEQMIEE